MSIAKVTEVKSSSTKSFEDAISDGIKRASETLENIKGAWVSEQEVVVDDGNISEYRVLLKLTFVLN